MYVRSFVRWYVCSFVRLYVCSFVRIRIRTRIRNSTEKVLVELAQDPDPGSTYDEYVRACGWTHVRVIREKNDVLSVGIFGLAKAHYFWTFHFFKTLNR